MDTSRELNVFDEFEEELEGFIADVKRLKSQNEELIKAKQELEERITAVESLLDKLHKKLKNIQWMVKELENGRKG